MKANRPNGVSISLTQKNFLTSGGEGSIYVEGNKAFKVYQDPKKVISKTKISELKAISLKNVICPHGHLTDTSTTKPLGYEMDFVKDTIQICALFTRAYKDQHHIIPEAITKLISTIRDCISYIHNAKILIVDMNELNILISKKNHIMPYFIDTDSYQTPSSPATAIMESVRDRHCNYKFSEGTDWFAFAIMAVQLLIGIHPYKGKHPDFKTLDERMMNNVSIFNSKVSLPKICNPIQTIPQGLSGWLKNVLEKGERGIPPMGDLTAVKMAVTVATAIGDIKLVEILSFDEDITYIDDEITILQKKVFYNNKPVLFSKDPVAFLPGDPVIKVMKESEEGEQFTFKFVARQNGGNRWEEDEHERLYMSSILADTGFTFGSNLYVKIEDKIFLVEFNREQCFATSTHVANVMSMSTRVFHNIVIQDCLKTAMGLILEGKISFSFSIDSIAGTHVSPSKIVNAYFENGVGGIVYQEGSGYKKLMFKINVPKGKVEVIDTYDINDAFISIAVKKNGVAVFTDSDGNAVITTNIVGDNRLKVIKSDVLEGERLAIVKDKIVVIRQNKIYEVKI